MKTNENFQLSTFNFQPDKRLAVVILNWNGSTDDSIEMLKTKFPTVGIIRLDKNYGFAEGYNQALKHIGHEYTVLLNSDVEVTPGWLDAPIAALDADKTIAGVQPKIRAQRNKEYCRVLCPPGRNRSVLAATFARLPAGLYAIVGRVPRGRRHVECRESAQDVPQLPKQPADAI